MRSLRTSVLFLLILVAAGCHDRSAESAPRESTREPTRAPAADRCAADTDTSKDMRRAAMLSVYFHAHYTSSDWVPPALRPIELRDAACILQAATGRFAESRRRRAIARLSAAGLHDPNRCEAVQILGAPIAELTDVLNRLAVSGAAAPAAAADAAAAPAANPCASRRAPLAIPADQAVTAVMNLLDRLGGGPAIENCDYEYYPADVSFDPKTWQTHAAAKTAVQRDLAGVCHVMDPQNWDEDDCSDFFTSVYVAKKTGGDYEVKKDFSVAEDTSPPAPCTPYEREMYEHFDVVFDDPNWPGSIIVAWYKNLLTIDSDPIAPTQTDPRPGHQYEYSLFDSLGSSVYFDVQAGGLGYDDGTITMRSRFDPSWTELSLTKTVLFTDRWYYDTQLNLLAGIFLEALAEELPEMACCTP